MKTEDNFEDIVLKIPYKAKKASEMTKPELCKYMALMNGLKFINQGEALTGVNLDEDDIPHKRMKKYIKEVEGDLLRCLNDYGGIPFKYSLDPSHEESRCIEEITFRL